MGSPRTYRSDYPNQVQQLNIYISQHYHLLKDETIAWQKKPFDIKWTDYKDSPKKHLVSFIIRDHFSNCSYAELHPLDRVPQIHEFLYNAWRTKDGYEFRGAPEFLMVPAATQKLFPSLDIFFVNTDKVKLITPGSGFQTGLASVRQWEKYISFFTGTYKDCKTIGDFQDRINLINKQLNSFPKRDSKTSDLEKWLSVRKTILNPGDTSRFFGFFRVASTVSSPVDG
jgi:hypothetical protein